MLMNWKRNWGYLIEKDKVHSRCSGKAACAEKNISKTYGEERAVRVVGTITNAIRGLCEYEEKGPLVSDKFDVITDYRYLFVSKNVYFTGLKMSISASLTCIMKKKISYGSYSV